MEKARRIKGLLFWPLVFCILACLAACGGSGGSSSSATGGSSTISTENYTAPTTVSAVPTSENAINQDRSLAKLSLRSRLKTLTDRLSADYASTGTDYSNARTDKYVEERTLKQFDVIEQVLGALSQTHYADAANINGGPYLAMVAWEEEQNGRSTKKLEPWIIDSREIVENDQNVLRVWAWIEEEKGGQANVVKAEFKIYAPATKRADGSYSNYGVWTMNVKFDDAATSFFAASASVAADGKSLIKVHESFPEGAPGSPTPLTAEMKALMYVSETAGYGQVYYPNFEALFGPGVDPTTVTTLPHKTAKYAYSTNYLAVQEEGGNVQYKKRNEVTEMVHRYGVFDEQTGQDVLKAKSFGFPFRYTGGDGGPRHGYYGAWQGRHQLWGPNGNATIAEGTTVTREDTPPGQEAETYTVGPTFLGVLVKRTLVDADINDVKNIPVEIWVNQDYNLIYNGGVWQYCTQMNWGANPPTCAVDLQNFDEQIGLASLIVGENDNRKWVRINRWVCLNESCTQGRSQEYVYEAASAENSGAGFYEATAGSNGRATVNTPRVKFSPQEGNNLNVMMGGSIFVEYTGTGATGWVEKEVVSFNTMNWTPEFGSNDRAYTLPLNKEIYVNMQGANYVVKRTESGYVTKLEIQTAANPTNATSVVQSGTVFKNQWNANSGSTYEFITDPSNIKYLMLVYKTVGDNDKDSSGNPKTGVEVGGVVQSDIWGLQAYIDSGATQTDAMFNWEYQASGDIWGSVTYLKNADGSYKLVNDPVRFESITAANSAGEPKNLSLQYDGWMMGLPMMYEELGKNNFVMTDQISNKIINLPEGTRVVDSSTGTAYRLKPIQVSQFLNAVTDTTGLTLPDISQASNADLTTVPNFVEHGMGDKPNITTVKYSEGKLVQ